MQRQVGINRFQVYFLLYTQYMQFAKHVYVTYDFKAFPNDIEAYKPEDPDDYLHGDKYTLMGFEHGPYAKRQGVKKTGMVRSKHIAFLKPNTW